MENFNVYSCIIDGNNTVAVDANMKPILRKCKSYAKRGYYTECWYTYSDGNRVLVKYWN